MIPFIGLMIGAYIITRMVETIINKETHGAVAICAFITIIIVLFCLAGLLFSNVKIPLDLPAVPRLQGIPGQ
jgi:hypothetical protein